MCDRVSRMGTFFFSFQYNTLVMWLQFTRRLFIRFRTLENLSQKNAIEDDNSMDEKILLETMDGFDEDAYLERMNRY